MALLRPCPPGAGQRPLVLTRACPHATPAAVRQVRAQPACRGAVRRCTRQRRCYDDHLQQPHPYFMHQRPSGHRFQDPGRFIRRNGDDVGEWAGTRAEPLLDRLSKDAAGSRCSLGGCVGLYWKWAGPQGQAPQHLCCQLRVPPHHKPSSPLLPPPRQDTDCAVMAPYNFPTSIEVSASAKLAITKLKIGSFIDYG